MSWAFRRDSNKTFLPFQFLSLPPIFSGIPRLCYEFLGGFYFLFSQSMQTSISLFVQKFFPHFMQTVFLSKPLSSDVTGLNVGILCGKLIALL
jgi:hypothetical protein